MLADITVRFLVATVLLIGGAEQAGATVFNNSTGIPGPVQTITFDEHVLPVSTLLANQYADVGVTFDNLLYDSQDYSAPNLSYPNAGNFILGATDAFHQFAIHFTVSRTSAAVAVVTNPGQTTTITALQNGVSVASQAFATGVSNPDFYGFTNLTFNEMDFSISSSSGFDYFALIDNLQLGQAVPEPTTLLLFCPATIALFTARRRRSNI